MSVKATTWVYENSPYTGIFFTVHLAIADIANDLYDNRFWLSEEALAAKARCSTRTVERAKARLVKDNYLEVVDGRHGPGKTNEYRFMMPTRQEITGDNLSGVQEITGDNLSGDHPTFGTEHPTNETEHPTNTASSLYINSRERKLTQDLTQLYAEREKSDKSQTLPGLIGEESSENTNDAGIAPLTANGKTTKPRKRDLLFDAMAEACGHDLTQLTKSSAAAIAKATSEIRPICKTPDEVWEKAAIYKKLHPDWVLTPSALAKYWSSLKPEQVNNQGSEKYRMHREFQAEILAKLARENPNLSVDAFRLPLLAETTEEGGFSTPIHKPGPERPSGPSRTEHTFEESGEDDEIDNFEDYEDHDKYDSDARGDGCDWGDGDDA